MRVLFHCCEFPPQAGGVGGYIYQMASCLTRMGNQAVVVTSRFPGLPELEDCECGRVYRIYNRKDARTLKVAKAVMDLARENKIDLVEGADHHGELAGIIRTKKRPPVVVKIHGSNPINVLQNSQIYYRWQKLTIWLAHVRNRKQTIDERFSIENAEMALMPSARMREELINQRIHIPRRNAVLPNPVLPFDGELNKESVAPTVLMVSRLDIGKGIQFLPGILRKLTSEFSDLTLEIAGDDSYARGIGSLRKWLVNRLGDLKGHVKFLGKLDREQLEHAYGRAWVVLLPSRWDNFPTVLLEAMIRGKPVVASPHGGMPEMLGGTLCGTAPPEGRDFINLVANLLRDSSLRKLAGESLKKKAKEAYAPEVIVKDYIGTLKQWGVSG